MKPEDQKAFEAVWARHSATRPVIPGDKALCGTFYELALAHRDAQPAGAQGEPVAEVTAKMMLDQEWRIYAYKVGQLMVGTKLYAKAPAAAINEPDPSECFNAAINYALKCGNGDGGLEFLACWIEGNFDAIRKEWPDAPDAVFKEAEKARGLG